MTYNLKKECEVCNTPVPDDFGNLLCEEHYKTTSKETERVQKQDEETKEPEYCVNGVTDPNYKEHPEADDKEQVMANLTQFYKMKEGSRVLLYGPTKTMYEYIKNYILEQTRSHMQFNKHIWQPTVVDVGCGGGFGANLISQEAQFVWGIDKNKLSVEFAQQAFTRIKNGVYYSTQVTFDQLDIIKQADTFTFAKFDIVVAIEVIEHIDDYKTFIQNIINAFSKKDKNGKHIEKVHHSSNGDWPEYTQYFFSTPNRNNDGISKQTPKNQFHVREWTSQEFHRELSRYFNKVKLMNSIGDEAPIDTNHTPLLALCSHPKI